MILLSVSWLNRFIFHYIIMKKSILQTFKAKEQGILGALFYHGLFKPETKTSCSIHKTGQGCQLQYYSSPSCASRDFYKNLPQKLIPECFISTLFQMALLIPFHSFHFHLNFHGSDFFFIPPGILTMRIDSLQPDRRNEKTQSSVIKDGQANLYLLVDLDCSKIFYSVQLLNNFI